MKSIILTVYIFIKLEQSIYFLNFDAKILSIRSFFVISPKALFSGNPLCRNFSFFSIVSFSSSVLSL